MEEIHLKDNILLLARSLRFQNNWVLWCDDYKKKEETFSNDYENTFKSLGEFSTIEVNFFF